jgi:NADH-quinone oxidoreductase subunit L
MTVALGASAYPVAIFHLMTHAFFKALLFLAAGSVIIGMHHNQDIRNMGGLRRYMPITWITSLVGSLALIGTPFLSGFYSKDSIIEAVAASHVPGAGFAHFAVLAGVFVTAFYSFRMYFLVFHGKERFPAHGSGHGDHGHDDHDHGGTPHESPWVVTLPLVLLAIPSLVIGHLAIGPMLFGDYFAGVIHISESHEAMAHLREHFHGATAMSLHALSTAPFWLAVAGVALAWWFYLKRPDIPAGIAAKVRPLHTLLLNKYYFDEFYNVVFAGGSRLLGRVLWRVGDVAIIDGLIVNGAARTIGWFSTIVRKFQSGLIYHYAFTMIIGVFVLLTIWFVRT